MIMKERPIIFSQDMLKAILEGRKTMTRRIWKNPWLHLDAMPCDFDEEEALLEVEFLKNGVAAKTGKIYDHCMGERRWMDCQFGKPGDRLWIRETWSHGCMGSILMKSNYTQEELNSAAAGVFEWKSPRFMPKVPNRKILEIVKIRFERVGDISANDAIAEGIELVEKGETPFKLNWYKDYLEIDDLFSSPVDSFMSLWIKINGEPAWKNNPFVWVIEFKKL